MAVTSQLTTLEDFEAPGATFNNIGGGPGASDNTDIFIQGSQSGGRRADNTTAGGFTVTIPSTDLSGANEHVKVWIFVTQWALVNSLIFRISDGTNDDDHTVPTVLFPDAGGFIPVWCDVSRTPEAGGSANEAAITTIGVEINIGNVGGAADNFILDEILSGTSGLLWDGTGGDFGAFRTYESTNVEGVFLTINGIDFCYARLEVGSATATTFTDSGFTIAFPDQGLVSDTFMGMTCDLQNASTAVTLSDGTLQSADPVGATKRPDFIVTGTAGTLDFDAVNLLGMRTVTLTSACTLTNCILDLVDLTQGSGEITGGTLRTRSASTVAMCDDPTFGASGIHDLTVSQSGSGHAFEIGAAGTYDLQGITFEGYGANASNDAALFINVASGTVTLNISNGGSTPTFRLPGGSTANVVINNAVNLVFNGIVSGSALVIIANQTVGSVTAGDVILSETVTTDPFSSSFNFEGDIEVDYRVVKGSSEPVFKPVEVTATISSAGLNENIVQQPD
jgi:hypothetical protein